ncbi:MAG: hypothetical protein FWC70_08100 [Defluviitaleaceae bacterium]|nr:hypothetical protein [Defluviitaleaceae bacterium]
MDTFKPLSAIQDGISVKLNKHFGDKYVIFPEEVKQGLTRPCFFIKLLNPSNKKEVGETYMRENSYCIHYFPENTNQPKTECYKTLDELYLAMEYIEVDGNLVRGVGMHGEIHDETLLFYVNYNVRVRKVYDPDLMAHLESIEFRTKG